MEMRLKSKSSIFVRNALFILALSYVTWYVLDHIRIPPTHSLSKRVFWSVAADAQSRIKTGQYVIFDQFVPKPISRDITFIKRAGCTAGEVLKVENDYYYCNGEYLGRGRHKTRGGVEMTPFIYNGAVPANMVFAVGDHPDSYDSRYIGFISRDRITRVAWAIF